MRVLALLAALALAAPAAAQFNINLNRLLDVGKNVQKATSEVDEKEEIEIGRDMAARLLGAAPLAADDALQRYVNHIGRWLALQTERPGLPWRFGVLDAPQLNAFATPGGHIFVTRGLVARMQNEAELAGVLAHEIAHVLRKHHLKAIQKAAQLELANTVIGTVARRDDASNRREKLLAAGSELFARGLDKEDELEADRLGVVIAARGGYDAYGLPAVLQTLQAMNPADSGLALMFKTHPSTAERLEALGTMQPTLDAYAGLPQLAQRFAGTVRR
ncbi:MAG: M48 family metalloprotease [Betaproteobacteria bacterium]|nr:M48 family metalloprotease [Betaproteobacteria bacterium]MDH5577670.1 M48 family metalloprotease [Betaproteobacteria bacterium]